MYPFDQACIIRHAPLHYCELYLHMQQEQLCTAQIWWEECYYCGVPKDSYSKFAFLFNFPCPAPASISHPLFIQPTCSVSVTFLQASSLSLLPSYLTWSLFPCQAIFGYPMYLQVCAPLVQPQSAFREV